MLRHMGGLAPTEVSVHQEQGMARANGLRGWRRLPGHGAMWTAGLLRRPAWAGLLASTSAGSSGLTLHGWLGPGRPGHDRGPAGQSCSGRQRRMGLLRSLGGVLGPFAMRERAVAGSCCACWTWMRWLTARDGSSGEGGALERVWWPAW